MGGACSTHEIHVKCVQMWYESLKVAGPPVIVRPRWGDNIKIDSRVISLLKEDWIQLAWDGDLWRNLVNTVMKVLFS